MGRILQKNIIKKPLNHNNSGVYNNKINEYYDLKKKLTGKINLNLDHPLSSQMIKKLKLGKAAQLFVQPLTAEINQGEKSLLDNPNSLN